MIETFGLPTAVAAVFIWLFIREHLRQGARVTELEKEQKGTITTLCLGAQKVIGDNAQATNRLCDVLQERPCLIGAKLERPKPTEEVQP